MTDLPSVDLTVQSSVDSRSPSPTLESSSPPQENATVADEARVGLFSPSDEDATELRTRVRPASVASNTSTSAALSTIKRKTSQLFEAVSGSSSSSTKSQLASKLKVLVDEYKRSDIANDIREDREHVRSSAVAVAENGNVESQLPDVAVETTLLRGRKSASWGTQFRILSGRAFKNLYRDPALLMAHYLSAMLLACGFTTILFHFLLSDCFCSVLWCFLPQCHVRVLFLTDGMAQS